ncbi:helix-hairpin-helix domain-containing protein [candidate division WOR-3 bacterium]|nr:helix-hairpin-helix domain-containing protein [candidate division WOR-3 bacterium]
MLIFLLLVVQLDINRAPLTEIYTLPVDSATAHRIYEYRELHGYFSSVYELRRVPFVDAVTFEKIKPLVKIAVPSVERAEWSSILYEQKKLASEEPPSKAAVDVWEEMIRSPIYINEADFNELLNIDRMTPIDAAAILRHRRERAIGSARDLRRVRNLGSYAYTSLRKYVRYEPAPAIAKPYGNARLRLSHSNRIDVGEDDNIATRISYLEAAVNGFDTLATKLMDVSGWHASHVAYLKDNLNDELDTLRNLRSVPRLDARVKINYRQKLRAGFYYDEYYGDAKGYAGLVNIGPVRRFYVGNYRIVWGEGLMIDNSDEYRARIFERSSGLYGDLTENYGYTLFGAAGDFSVGRDNMIFIPSFFYSNTIRDAILNPDGTLWRTFNNPYRFATYRDKVSEQASGFNFGVAPIEHLMPGAQVSLEAMRLAYDRALNPDPRWIDIPFDKYDPAFYPEITQLSHDSTRLFYGATFVVPVFNTFLSGEYVRQHGTDNPASAYIVKGRVQYDYLYLNCLYRHYDVAYDNPFNRGFSEYRRFEDTPFERPYALVDPEYASMYDDPAPKPEQGIYLETRYQLTRNIILTRAYIDVYKNLSHNLSNQRGYFEFEYQPVWPVRLRFSRKVSRKHLPRPVQATLSTTHESALKAFLYLRDYDAIRIEARFGTVDLTASEGEDLTLDGGFLSVSFTRNFTAALSLEGGIAVWKTDGMSQWIFEDVGIDFLNADGIKFFAVVSQKIGSMLVKTKFSHKYTMIPHTGLLNNTRIYYPELPGVLVTDYIDRENSTKLNLQIDYLF